MRTPACGEADGAPKLMGLCGGILGEIAMMRWAVFFLGNCPNLMASGYLTLETLRVEATPTLESGASDEYCSTF